VLTIRAGFCQKGGRLSWPNTCNGGKKWEDQNSKNGQRGSIQPKTGVKALGKDEMGGTGTPGGGVI